MFEDELAELESLQALEEREQAFDDYLAARREAIDLLEEGRDAAEENDPEGYADAQAEVAAGQVERAELAREAGLSDCSRRSRAASRRPADHRRRASHPKPSAAARLKAPASRSAPRPAGGTPASAPRTSVASSVARSQASAHQSSGRSRAAATVCAARVSQIGPQRRNRCSASGEGSSWPITRSVAPGGDRRRPEREVEGDQVAVGQPQRSARGHRRDPTTHSPEGKPRPVETNRAVAKTATKSRSGNGRPARKRPEHSSRCPSTSPSASTSSRARRRTSPATSSTTSTRPRSRPPRSWRGAPTPRPRRSSASRRRSASRAIPSFSRRRSRSTARAPGDNGPARPLFDFDHSEFEASLAADHANLEETARSLTREQVEACVSALADAQRVVIVGVDQMAFFASYLRHLLALLDIRAEVVAEPAPGLAHPPRPVDEDTLVIAFSAGRAHPLVVRAMKLAKHRRARRWRSPTRPSPRSASTPS